MDSIHTFVGFVDRCQFSLSKLVCRLHSIYIVDQAVTTNSEHIQSLHPALQLRVWAMIGILATQGISVRVLYGFRDRDLQKELFAKWKAGKGGKAAKPGLSFHNYGLACDMVPYTDEDHDQQGLIGR